MSIRIAKISLLGSIGFYTLLVVFNNVTDYGSNLEFVRHVLSMDDTFQHNQGMWRSLPYETFHSIFYGIIILTEAVVAYMCLRGTWALWVYRNAETELFHKAKKWGIRGLTLGILLWFVGFISIGGEWFLMWQSSVWNGSEVAFRNTTVFVLALLFLSPQHE